MKFITIIIAVLILASCKTSKSGCDAYGKEGCCSKEVSK